MKDESDDAGSPGSAYVGVPWLAVHFNLSPDTIRHQLLFVPARDDEPVPTGKLVAVRIGSQYRVHRAAVEAFDNRHKSRPESDPAAVKTAGRHRRVRFPDRVVIDHFSDL